MRLYEDLLKEWCDALVDLQIVTFQRKELYGGILCPSCARVHGRCGDAIYPMMSMYRRTKDEKYLNCAKRVFEWSENMIRPDGGYNNDTNSDWRGITVFAQIQLGEALHYHGDLLDEETREIWKTRFGIASDYLYHNIERIGGNVNYPVTCAHAMAVAGKLLKEERYHQKARELATEAMKYLTEEGLLYGEGLPREYVSPKGCRPVDLGYNVEESLPAMAQYAILEGDEKVREAVLHAMGVHLEFMLPDGAWDNSWGTRNNKWSYWGSRTSDGCQSGFAAMAVYHGMLGEAVYRNTKLLRECTHEGLLYGGPMYVEAGERPCVHHTFCHAKALAAMLDAGHMPVGGQMLPREKEYGLKHFPLIHVNLISIGGIRGTVSDYDVEYSEEGHATGGAITLLWHKATGPLICASMNRYQLVEPNNMQLASYMEDICLTPRFELRKQELNIHGVTQDKVFSSINDKCARVICRSVPRTDDNIERIEVESKGKLRDGKMKDEGDFQLHYEFTDQDELNIGITAVKSPDITFRWYPPRRNRLKS